MKGNYRHNSPDKKRVVRLVYISLFLVIVLFIFQFVLGGVSSVAGVAIQKTSYWLSESTGSIPAYFRERSVLINRISDLESELAAGEGDRLVINNLVQENIYLRSLLGDAEDERILANIIARPPQVSFDAFLLDRGLADNVQNGAIVYINNNIAIGVVVRVFETASVVKLITSPDTVSSVFIAGPNVYAQARGMGGGILQIAVPQGIVLEPGNNVIVPALGAGVYGEISNVVSIPTEPVQIGIVTIAVATQAMRTVTIGMNPIESVSFDEINAEIEQTVLDMLRVNVPNNLIFSASSSPTTTSEYASTSQTAIID